MKNKPMTKVDFDSFEEPGKERASTNERQEITDWEVTDLIQFIDENTDSDEDFHKEFTIALFKEFGWRFYTKVELEVNIPLINDDDLN